jgi:hypothetical protein
MRVDIRLDATEMKVIELLEIGVEPEDIASQLNLTLDEVMDIEDYACENRDCDDGQPSEYQEWQDYMGGDDWDQGQYDSEY